MNRVSSAKIMQSDIDNEEAAITFNA